MNNYYAVELDKSFLVDSSDELVLYKVNIFDIYHGRQALQVHLEIQH